MNRYDVIVIGLGHAGCEAALACARMGLTVLAVTLRKDRIGVMSCNPSVGGPGKSQLVRELDALGGEMAKVGDITGTHFRRLNESKGPAVRATRVLCDRSLYAQEMGARVLNQPGVTVLEGEAKHLLSEGERVVGVSVSFAEHGDRYEICLAKAVIVTAGTFLKGVMHIGDWHKEGGRVGDIAACGLSESLRAVGLQLGRFKTGTPARLNGETIDWNRTQIQPGDEIPRPLSFTTGGRGFPKLPQLTCGIAYTNADTHRVVRENLHRSALYGGNIVGTGPRYCPSLEDKVVRFAHRERHAVFLEPDGLETNVVYPAGVSTSLPAEVQSQFLRTIPGLEQVDMLLPGYAIEYDFVLPTQLDITLAAKCIRGLWLAGQVVGTSGYEEAAVQGFWAGVNAACYIQGRPSFILKRNEALIGVLVDDLVTKGTDEPYRIFTSRAEHRLLLREDNADLRLAKYGYEFGLVNFLLYEQVEEKRRLITQEVERLEKTVVSPTAATRNFFEARGWQAIRAPSSLSALLRRPEVELADLAELEGRIYDLALTVKDEIETVVRYGGYIERQEEWVQRVQSLEGQEIADGFDFRSIRGFSREIQERLIQVRPRTVGQAARIPGITPAAIGLLAVHVGRKRR